MKEMRAAVIVNAILEACTNAKFLQYIAENHNKEESEALKFSIDGECFAVYRSENRWCAVKYTEPNRC